MCTLDLSKVLMYEFHYDYIKNNYGNNSKLLVSDTDSLMYEIKTEDVYKNFSKDKEKEVFDFSNYSSRSKYYDDSKILVVGYRKDKTGVVVTNEYGGLKAKMYSLLVGDHSNNKKAKGVNANVVEKITHSEYKNVLLNKKCLRNSLNRIQSKKHHRIGAYKINKTSLSCFHHKIFILNNGYDGLAFGY